MRITIMNASPKKKNSSSQQLMERLIPFLNGEEYGILEVNPEMDEKLALTAASLSDAWIIVAPVYVDSLPSSMLAYMDLLEAKVRKKGIKVGAILQSGFYEAENTELAMELIRQWCAANDYTFAAGMGIGGGATLQKSAKIPTGRWYLKPFQKAYPVFVQALKDGTGEVQSFSIGMPKRLYTWMAERQWKKAIRSQGLEEKDLSYQPEETNENFSKGN